MDSHQASASKWGRWSWLRADNPEGTCSSFFPVLSLKHVLLALGDRKPILDVQANSSGIFGKVKYLLLLCALWTLKKLEVWTDNGLGTGLSKSSSKTHVWKKQTKTKQQQNLDLALFGCNREYQEEKKPWDQVSFGFPITTLLCKWI